MSKSRGNVINPDDIVRDYGADALRLYEMFLGPLEQVKPWSTKGVEGVFRFLGRAWRLVLDEEGAPGVTDVEPARDELRLLHQTIQKVTGDVEALRFNTAIAAMMEFVNKANKWARMPRAVAEGFVLLLGPFAPHLAEELWQRLGHEESLAYAPWPEVNEAYLKEDELEIPVQVNGKVRASITVAADAGEAEVLAAAREHENVTRYLDGGAIRREIYVPGRIVNLVVGLTSVGVRPGSWRLAFSFPRSPCYSSALPEPPTPPYSHPPQFTRVAWSNVNQSSMASSSSPEGAAGFPVRLPRPSGTA